MLATYGRRESGRVWLGSLKSNIGHMQGAAGVGGVMKMVLALRNNLVPATLHVDIPTPEVDWSSGAVELATVHQPWPRNGRPRRAAVSAFGISGTNAHVILEEAPEEAPDGELPAAGRGRGCDGRPVWDWNGPGVTVPWVVSGRSEQVLRGQAGRLLGWLDGNVGVSAADVAWSLATSRSVFGHRAVVLGGDLAELRSGLAALAEGNPAVNVVAGGDGGGVVAGPGAVFVFPGQGGQWRGMAGGLLESSPVFAGRLAQCAEVMDELTGWSLLDVVRGVDGCADVERVDVVQPVLFAVMVSLAAVWEACGVAPAAVVGHSQGEIAAACVAGVLSLADAVRVVVCRSAALRGVTGSGGMASIGLPVAVVVERLREMGVSVAAVNGPSSTVVSGDGSVLDRVCAEFAAQGAQVRRIPVDYASHSPAVEVVEQRLAEELGSVVAAPGRLPVYSTVTGERLDGRLMDAGYWYRNLRETVRLEETVRGLIADGFRVFVEASTHPVLTAPVEETADAAGVEVVTVGSLRRDDGGMDRFLTSLAEVFIQGVPVDWPAVHAGSGGRSVDLPTYAFDRQRYWADSRAKDTAADRGDPAEAEFWRAVADGDAEALASVLAGPGTDPVIERDRLADLLPALSAWRERRRDATTLDRWRYQVTWRRVDDPPLGAFAGHWLVVRAADSPGQRQWADMISGLFAARGVTVGHVAVAATDRDRGPMAQLLSLAGASEPVAGLICLLALADGEAAAPVPAGLTDTLTLMQALDDVGIDAPLWCLTRQAVSTGPTDPTVDPASALVWGLGRVAALERSERWGGLVDIPARPSAQLTDRVIERIAAVVTAPHGQDQVAIRESGVFTRRLVRWPRGSRQTRVWSAAGTVLITGGTGALGARVARWVVDRGADHVVLLSRRGADAPSAAELTAQLRDRGARVTVVAADVADRDAVARLARDLAEAGDPITAVFHTAGVADEAPLRELTKDELTAVLGAKVTGAQNLHDLLDDHPISTFVLFSSIAGIWGGGGQAAYSAANAYLDGLAAHRAQAGRPATAIAWGSWGGGMVDAERGQRLRRGGVLPMDPDLALAAMEAALADGENTLVVADMDWELFFPAFTVARHAALLADLPEVEALLTREAAGRSAEETAFAQRLADLPALARTGIVLDLVRREVAAVLGHASAEAVEPDRAFRDSGFDSLTTVELRSRLRAATGSRMPVTAVFDHPTPRALAAYLVGDLLGEAADDVAGEPRAEHADPVEDALAELDRLEATFVAAASAEPADRSRLLTRLRVLADAVNDGPAGSDGGAAAATTVLDVDDGIGDLLTAASDDEIFSFIDTELDQS